ncbi:MAG: hypothetical protein ACYC6W_11765 [Nitrosotalea sp.]
MPLIPITAQQASNYPGNGAPNPVQANLQQPGASLQQTQTGIQQTQAAIPGTQAESAIKGIQSQQVAAPQALSKDLANKMTLSDAMSKYKALGMKPDDIFNNYLSQSPYGIPKETPSQLNAMGVSNTALGQPGQQNTFADKASTRGAIEEINKLQSLWNDTNEGDRAAGILGMSDKVRAYNQQLDYVNAHYPSLLTAPQGETTAANIAKDLPSLTDLRIGNDSANQLFNNAKTNLLTQKQYTPSDVGLKNSDLNINPSGKTQQSNKTPSSGGDLLTSLLNNSGSDIKNRVSGILNTIGEYGKTQFTQGPGAAQAEFIGNMIKGNVSEYGSLLSNPLQHAKEHPINTILDVLPFLGATESLITGPAEAAEAAEGAAAAGEGAAKVGANALDLKNPGVLQKMFKPGQIKANAGAARDTLVNQSTQTGVTIPGDNIVNKITDWANNIGKPGNPGQGAKIDTIVNEVKDNYAGKQLTPADTYKIYNEVDNGYNQKGLQKDAIQSRGDIALRGILRGEIDNVSPGFNKLTDIIGQGYQAEKSPSAQLVKNLPKNAVKAGMNVAGLGVLREFLGL